MSSGDVAVDALCEEAAKLKLEGNDLFKAKKYKAAASKYREAIDKDQCNAVYYTNLCACLNQLKLYDEMNTFASKCIAMNENSVKGHYWLIMSFKHLKKYKKALKRCDTALEKFPDNTDIKLLRSEIGNSQKRCGYAMCPTQSTTTSFKCSGCQNVYYCSRKCQKKDWHQHKISCKSNIAQCFKCNFCEKMSFPNNLVRCRHCSGRMYCSIECEENDKVQHGPACLMMRQRGRSKEMELFHKWFDSNVGAKALIHLATHAMTKSEFLCKEPSFYIDIELCFSGKYCSFIPTQPPNVIYLSEIHPMNAAEMKHLFDYKSTVGQFMYGHVMVVRFKVDGEYVCRRRHQQFGADEYQKLTLEEAMTTSFNHVNCMTNPILPTSWKDILAENFAHQVKAWCDHAQKNDELFNFVLSSYRYQSKTNKRPPKEYALMVEIEFGEQLGEIKRIVSHSVKRLSDIKDQSILSELKSNITSLSNQDPDYVVFTLSFISDNRNSPHVSSIPFRVPVSKTLIKSNKKEKEYKAEARKLWKYLLKVPFPKCPPTPQYPDTFNTS